MLSEQGLIQRFGEYVGNLLLGSDGVYGDKAVAYMFAEVMVLDV